MTKIDLPYVHAYRDRQGRLRHYVRRRGCPGLAPPGLPGSEEFMSAYQAALASQPTGRKSKHGAGSLAQLATEFYRSIPFANLKPSSQATYRAILDPLLAKHGHRLVRDMPRDKITKIIVEIGQTRPAMANLTKSILHRLMAYAVDVRWRKDNPVKVPDYKTGAHHTWTDEEMAAFERRWPLGTRERLAYAAFLYTAQRGGDVVKMRRPAADTRVIRLVQEKTGAELVITVHPALARAIKAGPSNGVHLIGDKRGKPITRAELTTLLRGAIRTAGLPPRCKAHGLRKSAMRRLAEAGAPTKELQAVSGHRTIAEVERYTNAADQGRLNAAAMARLKDEDGTSDG